MWGQPNTPKRKSEAARACERVLVLRESFLTAWPAPASAAYAGCPACPARPKPEERPCCCNFFELPLEAAKARIRSLLGATNLSVTQQRTRSEMLLVVDLSRPRLLRDLEYRAVLDEFTR
jgi:hypothetical protein